MTDVVVVGGGAAGVLAAAALGGAPGIGAVTVVERDATVGPGLAYGRAEPHHLLNSLAGRMSAFGDDADHFVRWCGERGLPIGAHDFAPRRVYGDYLADVFATLLADSRRSIWTVRGEVVSISPAGRGSRVHLADGTVLPADRVVLAVGNPPPHARGLPAAGRAVPDPWRPGALEALDGARRVLLIGTGLTAVDVATTLTRRDPRVAITATSRGLLLPRTHLQHHVAPGPGLPDGLGSLGAVLSAFSHRLRVAREEGRPWQAEVDGVRPQVNRLWSELSLTDRRRFIARVSRRWEVHRHRMAPAVSAEVHGLLDSGALRLEHGVDPGSYDAVVDCTGPRAAASTDWNPVVTELLAAGHARPDALGIGLDVAASGALRTASGEDSALLLALGTVRRGSQWESTAIPEIRQHAQAIAAAVSS